MNLIKIDDEESAIEMLIDKNLIVKIKSHISDNLEFGSFVRENKKFGDRVVFEYRDHKTSHVETWNITHYAIIEEPKAGRKYETIDDILNDPYAPRMEMGWFLASQDPFYGITAYDSFDVLEHKFGKKLFHCFSDDKNSCELKLLDWANNELV